MDGAIYLRKSRLEEQSNQAETLQRHREVLFKIADNMGLNIRDVYEEVVSGESLYARPQMLSLLQAVEAGGIDAVLCMDIDRLGRGGMRDQGIILDSLQTAGAKIVTPDHVYDLDDDTDEQLMEFRSFIARQEHKQIKKRFRVGKVKSLREGCFLSMAPFGYRNVTVNKKPTLEVVPDEAEYVQTIYDMYCAGSGCTAIANALNAAGVRSRLGNLFSRNSVFKILRNPVYTGMVYAGRTKHVRPGMKGNDKHLHIPQPQENWIVVKGLHQPIITDEQFRQVQQIAEGRYIPPSNDGTIKSPLAGLIRCGRCGRNMQRQPMSYTDVSYLSCSKPGCCAMVKYEFIEPTIMGHLQDKLAELRAGIPQSDPRIPYETLLAGIRSETSKVTRQKDNVHNLLEQGEYDVETYRERMKVLTDRLTELSAQEQSALADIEKHRCMDPAELAAKIKNALDVYDSCDAAGRNRILKAFIDHIDYYKEKKSKPTDFELFIYYK
jgi:DNA invertase Pin-like site-specific DNA recombinase